MYGYAYNSLYKYKSKIQDYTHNKCGIYGAEFHNMTMRMTVMTVRMGFFHKSAKLVFRKIRLRKSLVK